MGKYLTKEIFIERSKKEHGAKYDYSESEYVGSTNKIKIICHEKDEYGIEHGEFWQSPSDHMGGHGCRKCSGTYSYTTNEFIDRANLKYNNKYDYSKVIYNGCFNKISIICHEKDIFGEEHGEFLQKPSEHLNGCSCPKCGNKYIPTTNEYIKKVNLKHNYRYDYSKVEYVKAHKKICIICNEVDKNGVKHGEFWQTPNNHLNGTNCPKCNSNKKSKTEEYVSSMLTENNVTYEREKTFDWLKLERNLLLDFYLPNEKIAIEVQGEQHFVSIKRYGGEDGFKLRQERDKAKLDLCIEHGIKIVYIRKDLTVLDDLLNSLKI